mgnify:CR=1 FL=1
MKKKLSTRSFPISEKLRLVSIVLFYVSIALVVLALVAFPAFLIIGIIVNAAFILTGLYTILASLAGLIVFQLVILLLDSLALAMHRLEKDVSKEDLEHFNNSFTVPDELDKKVAEAKAKKAARKAAEAEARASKNASEAHPAAPAEPTAPTPIAPIAPAPSAPEAPSSAPEPTPNGWTCTCGQVNEEDAKFCANCGSPKPAPLF